MDDLIEIKLRVLHLRTSGLEAQDLQLIRMILAGMKIQQAMLENFSSMLGNLQSPPELIAGVELMKSQSELAHHTIQQCLRLIAQLESRADQNAAAYDDIFGKLDT